MAINNFSCLVNVSDDSVTKIAWIVNHPGDPDYNTMANGYAIAVIESLLLIIGLPWNTLVIWIIIRKGLFSQPALILMLNLAITNFLLGIFVMPLNIITGFAGEFIFGPTDRIRCRVCQIGVVLVILPWVTIHTLALMSVDRFIYLKRPLKYSSIVTPKRMLLVIILTWFICVSISLPPLFGFGEINFSYAVAACTPYIVDKTFLAPNFYYSLFLMLEASVPLLTLFVMYMCILVIIRKHLLSRHQKAEREFQKKQLRLVKVFGTILMAHMITWLPSVILSISGIVISLLNGSYIPTIVVTIPYLLFLFQTVVHPILQGFLIEKIREEIRNTVAPLTTRIKCRKFMQDNH